MPAHLKETGKTFAQYKEEIETFVVDSLAPWGVRSLVHLNAYPCFSRMLRARLFAVGWDGHTPLEIPPGATTNKTMEELLGVEKLPWWWAKEGRGRGVCPLAALTTL